jgi:hypothetical protein
VTSDFALSSASLSVSPKIPSSAALSSNAPASSAGTASASADSGTASKRPLLNPSLHVDVALNLVVLEFIDDKGDVTNSIPSPKQLKAYRDHDSSASAAGGLSVNR